MASEHTKGTREVEVFQQFLERANLPIDPASVEKRLPPAPDIFCMHSQRGGLAFELVELCDPDVAQLISKARDDETDFILTADPSRIILKKKLKRKYETEFPIELLCYTDGRIVTPDDVLLPTIRPIFESLNLNRVFGQAWLLGESGVHLIWGDS